MTGFLYQRGDHATAWQRYLNETHAAQAAYLAQTAVAHKEYLQGPWPDRATYERVEHQCWLVYYQASRESWQKYQNAMTSQPPPPAAPVAAVNPYPVSDESYLSVINPPSGPQFTPRTQDDL